MVARGRSGPRRRSPVRTLPGRSAGEPVHAGDDAQADPVGVVGVGREGRHGVVLVVEGEVPEPVLGLGAGHPPDAVLHDDRHLVGEGRVVGGDAGDGGGQEQRVAVLVLEALAVEGGPAGGAAEQEPAAPHVAEGPQQVAHPLEAEHGVEEVAGDQRLRPRWRRRWRRR